MNVLNVADPDFMQEEEVRLFEDMVDKFLGQHCPPEETQRWRDNQGVPRDLWLKAGEAWYGNTGSFINDRFKDGKPSASRDNCEYVLVMMLDDVGDPEKTTQLPPLPPTWIVETSAGSYQWGYVFSEQPTKADFAAAIKAIAAAGYTDPGACNPVRNYRLPGSVNLNPVVRALKPS